MNYLYGIKLNVLGKPRIKIGEYQGSSNRISVLIRKYRSKNPETLFKGLELPHTKDKRLNDHKVRRALIATGKFKKTDNEVVQLALNESDGKEELIEPTITMSDEEIKQCIEDVVSSLADPINFTAKYIEVRQSIVDTGLTDEQFRKHKVSIAYYPLFKKFLPADEEICFQKILFIGQYDKSYYEHYGQYNEIYALVERNRFEKPDTIANVTYLYDDIEEIIKMGIKFDLIIANPPYALGTEITKKVIENVEFDTYINLMPKKCYKSDNYKYVENIEKAPDLFDDAVIADVLSIAKIRPFETGKYKLFDDIEIITANPEYSKFFRENLNRTPSFDYTYQIQWTKEEDIKKVTDSLTFDRDFITIYRISANGVDTSGFTYDWNVSHIDTREAPYSYYDSAKGYKATYGFIRFNSKVEKDNFTDWYYRKGKDGLAHKLLKGLNKASGSVKLALPRVDWTRPWTDEEILLDYGYTPEEIRLRLE